MLRSGKRAWALTATLAVGLSAAGACRAETVVVDIHIKASPAKVWAAVRDVYHADQVTPGALKSVARDGDDRIMTFADGSSVRQHIVNIDEQRRRVVFAAVGTSLKHHSSAMQVFPDGSGAEVVWTTDFLPDAAKDSVQRVMAEASQSMKRTLEAKP